MIISNTGIDLGDGRVKVAIPDANGNPTVMPFDDGALFMPSAVYFNDDGSKTFGQEALNMGLASPNRLVVHWKRGMGSADVLYTEDDGTEYRSCDIAQLLLGEVARTYESRTGEILKNVSISVPAVYLDSKKQETEDAGKALSMKVICMPHEPTAAMFGNRVYERHDGIRIIIDIGSSTTDVSVGEKSGNTIDIKNTSGDPNLGGQDFSSNLRELVLERFDAKFGYKPDPQHHALACQDLHQRIEQVKHTLSTRNQASVVLSCNGDVFSTVITRADFESVTQDELQRVMDCVEQALKDSNVTADELVEIIPVGGPSQMPMIADAIEKRFGKKPTCHCEPHFAVALGNVITGRLNIERSNDFAGVTGTKLPPLSLSVRDVITHPIGIAVVKSETDMRLINAVVLKKGTPMPSDQAEKFTLAMAGQTDARIEILQGADGQPKDTCLLLGHFELKGMTPIHDKPHRIDIRLKINENGMLNASAYDPESGINADLIIDYKSANPKAKKKTA